MSVADEDGEAAAGELLWPWLRARATAGMAREGARHMPVVRREEGRGEGVERTLGMEGGGLEEGINRNGWIVIVVERMRGEKMR